MSLPDQLEELAQRIAEARAARDHANTMYNLSVALVLFLFAAFFALTFYLF